jgi:8-oxo-dGTP pyrophosphatase MutT (NUDIX family)
MGLGQARTAVRAALTYAERFTGTTTHARGRANRFVILTRIAIARGDLDQAAETTRHLLGAAEGMESRRFRDRLQFIRDSIGRHRSSAAVRDVTEELDATLALPLQGDTLLRWKTISETTVNANQWFSLNRADVELPDGTHLDHYLLRQPPVAVAALLNESNQVLLLWRHRFIPDSWEWELPSGKVEEGEEIADAAAREALEETGWAAVELRHLITVEVSGGFSDARHHVYWTEHANYVQAPVGVQESDRVEWISLDDVPHLIADGDIKAAHTVAALLTLRQLRAAAQPLTSSQCRRAADGGERAER